MKECIARICYNDQWWRRPSGPTGKGQLKNSFENKYKFGHEEWLLDRFKVIDGYHYSFLQPLGGFKHKGEIMDVHLYYYAKGIGKLYIGVLRKVECLTEEQSEEAYKIYEENGWLKEMQEDVEKIGGDKRALLKAQNSIFNIRFRFEDAELNLSNPRIISWNDPNTRATYYTLYEKKGDFVFSDIPATSKKHKQSPKKSVELKEENRRYFVVSTKEVSYVPQHNKIQNAIKSILVNTKEYKRVVLEENYVDLIAVNSSDNSIDFYEVKTDSSARLCIRKALGQVLEYFHYPDVTAADRMIIVGIEKPDEFDIKYLHFLRNRYHLNIWYRFYSLDNNCLSNMY